MNNSDERDYAEEAYNRALLREEDSTMSILPTEIPNVPGKLATIIDGQGHVWTQCPEAPALFWRGSGFHYTPRELEQRHGVSSYSYPESE